jgi:type III pantothenate kinase
MLLCVDAGNSRFKAALWNGADWQERVALGYADLAGWCVALPVGIESIAACSVTSSEATAPLPNFAAQRGIALDWLRPEAEHAGVRNGYARPEQLGADRWAALIGARGMQLTGDKWRRPLLVVLAGTATTIDALSPDGWFRGGVIVPGLQLMRDSLARGTARLPQVDVAVEEPVRWANNTEDAIAAGSLEATAGAIERLFARLRVDSGQEPMCLVAGGAGETLRSALAMPAEATPDLILEGLRRHAATRIPA